MFIADGVPLSKVLTEGRSLDKFSHDQQIHIRDTILQKMETQKKLGNMPDMSKAANDQSLWSSFMSFIAPDQQKKNKPDQNKKPPKNKASQAAANSAKKSSKTPAQNTRAKSGTTAQQ